MRNIILFCLIFFSLLNAKAQSNAEDKLIKREKVEAMKIAFLTDKLELTTKEAQVFWPLYNEYEAKMDLLRKNRKKDAVLVMETLDKLSDKEAESLVDSEIKQRQQELDIQKEYHEKFKKTLPIKKVAKLYATENDFKRQLLKKIKEQKK